QLDSPKPLLVTLNATDKINPDLIIRRIDYEHPVYNLTSVKARRRWQDINGQHRTHYCGAYWGYGFHEDGLQSAKNVVDMMQARD
ncbi:MAG: NAD(P)/FAD-dependent oxidoreductase, partial [Gammaproteobacteria bacterium]